MGLFLAFLRLVHSFRSFNIMKKIQDKAWYVYHFAYGVHEKQKTFKVDLEGQEEE
jgi:ABC-type Zn2+ transport system substrate-binding protein/surface adhesin